MYHITYVNTATAVCCTSGRGTAGQLVAPPVLFSSRFGTRHACHIFSSKQETTILQLHQEYNTAEVCHVCSFYVCLCESIVDGTCNHVCHTESVGASKSCFINGIYTYIHTTNNPRNLLLPVVLLNTAVLVLLSSYDIEYTTQTTADAAVVMVV